MNITTEQAKKVLSDAGYCVENLWHISDVTDNYHCSDEQAKKLFGKLDVETFLDGQRKAQANG